MYSDNSTDYSCVHAPVLRDPFGQRDCRGITYSTQHNATLGCGQKSYFGHLLWLSVSLWGHIFTLQFQVTQKLEGNYCAAYETFPF